jgi:hypothetical protein
MEKFRISFDGWQDRLDCCWKQLPPEKKRRIVLYSFAGYLLITIAIILQVIYQMGNAPDKIGIEHIHNPVAKPQAAAVKE